MSGTYTLTTPVITSPFTDTQGNPIITQVTVYDHATGTVWPLYSDNAGTLPVVQPITTDVFGNLPIVYGFPNPLVDFYTNGQRDSSGSIGPNPNDSALTQGGVNTSLFVKSVNGVTPVSGAVTLTEAQLGGPFVNTVNGVTPDGSGNVAVSAVSTERIYEVLLHKATDAVTTNTLDVLPGVTTPVPTAVTGIYVSAPVGYQWQLRIGGRYYGAGTVANTTPTELVLSPPLSWGAGTQNYLQFDDIQSPTSGVGPVYYAIRTNTSVTGSTAPAPAVGAPASVTATGQNTRISVAWTSPTTGDLSSINGWQITTSPATTTTTTSGTARSAVLTGLTNGTAYTVSVSATTDGGHTYGPARTATATPAAASTLAYVQKGSGSFNGASGTATLDGAPTAGNLLVAIASCSQFNATRDISASGWTQQGSLNSHISGGLAVGMRVLTHVVTAGESATYSFNESSSTGAYDQASVVLVEIVGADTTTPVPVISADTTSNTITSPNATPTTIPMLALAAYGTNDGSGSSTPESAPTSWTSGWQAVATVLPTYQGLHVARRTANTTDTTTAQACTINNFTTSSGNVNLTVLVKSA